MISKALGQYPHIRFREGKKFLWNPVLRKSFKVRPEERVRLQLVEYLLNEATFSRSRISFEAPVKLTTDKTQSRTDLICYTNDMKAFMLCECKSNKIALDEKTALQISRYNTIVGAPYLLISNGITDYWFEVKDDKSRRLQEIPDEFTPSRNIDRNLDYWTERGFVRPSSFFLDEETILQMMDHHFNDPFKPVKYLSFEGMPPELGLDHYYSIHNVNDEYKIAFSFSATENDSRFNVILNSGGDNIAYLSVSLKDASLQSLGESASGKQVRNLKQELLAPLSDGSDDLVPVLFDLLTSL